VKYVLKITPTAVTQRQSCTHKLKRMADELVRSHKDEMQIHHSTHQVAQSVVIWIIVHGDLGLKWYLRRVWLKKPLIQQLALQNSCWMNDVIFIWFTDRNLFAFATMKNPHDNQMYSSVATKKK